MLYFSWNFVFSFCFDFGLFRLINFAKVFLYVDLSNTYFGWLGCCCGTCCCGCNCCVSTEGLLEFWACVIGICNPPAKAWIRERERQQEEKSYQKQKSNDMNKISIKKMEENMNQNNWMGKLL